MFTVSIDKSNIVDQARFYMSSNMCIAGRKALADYCRAMLDHAETSRLQYFAGNLERGKEQDYYHL